MKHEAAFRRGAAALVSLAVTSFLGGYLSSGRPFRQELGGAVLTPVMVSSLLGLDLAPAREGIHLRAKGKDTTVSVTDLVAAHAFERGPPFPLLDVSLGADKASVLRALEEKGANLEGDATLDRVFTPKPLEISASSLRKSDLVARALRAGRYLARTQAGDGTFLYFVDPTTSHPILAEYSWSRHAGVTMFLAELAKASGDVIVEIAAKRGGEALIAHIDSCGDFGRCIIEKGQASLGTSALALLALEELSELNADSVRGEKELVTGLARFLEHMAHADGSFSSALVPSSGLRLDDSELYSSGEATLGLARFGEDRTFAIARAGLAHLIKPAWSFFGNRYYYSQEHWTCQAASAIARISHDDSARAFCLRVQAYEAAMQIADGSENDGGFGIGPLPPPQVGQAAARAEGWIATLASLEQAEMAAPESAKQELLRLLAFLARRQDLPAAALHDPALVDGALPMSSADLRLRMDNAQHAGSAFLRASRLGWVPN